MSASKWTRVSIGSTAAGFVLAGVAYATFAPGTASPPEPPAQAPRFDTPAEALEQVHTAVQGFDGAFPTDPKVAETADGGRSATLAAVEDRVSRRLAREAKPEPGMGPVVFEPGYAESLVVDEWICSWEGQFLKARGRGDKAAAASALAELGTLHDLGYAKAHVQDPGRGWQSSVLEPARKGNVTRLTAEYKACTDGAAS